MLENLKDQVFSCVECKVCDSVCSFYLSTEDEEVGAWNRIKAAQAILNNEKTIDDIIKAVYTCTCCGTCESICPMNIPISDVVRSLRNLTVKEEKVPEPIANLCKNIIRSGSMTGEGSEYWKKWIPDGIRFPEKAEHIYLVGCMIPFRLHEIGHKTVDIFSKAGFDFTILGEQERCCGLLLVDHGFFDEAKKIAESNIAKIEEKGVDRVLTACAACYYTYKHVYPRIFRKPGFEVLHVVEVLSDLVDQGKIKFGKRVEEKVVFLDPCHFAKTSKKYDEPRKIIESIPGIKLLEFSKNRDEGYCCGAPGGIRLLFRDIANSVAMMIIREALDLGVSRIITACPLCMYQLASTIRKREIKGLKVTDLPILLHKAL
ncbi:MAG: (Fe-S)-binding protein [Candidatus Baldrarchaeia archaeon]